MSKSEAVGFIHSVESMGALDGPGLRTVVFFQGCPLKCKFCHNIDTNVKNTGAIFSVEELVKKVLKNQEYWVRYNGKEEQPGGVTFTGGEPVYQPGFLLEVLKKLKEKGVHTVIDTSISTTKEVVDSLTPYLDLWMISIKHMDDTKHKDLTTVSNREILENIKHLDQNIAGKGQIRIRFLVIPGVTDSEEHVKQVGEFVKGIKNLEQVELLAYGTHGKYKWIELFGKYDLEGVPEATKEDMERVKEYLSEFGFKVAM